MKLCSQSAGTFPSRMNGEVTDHCSTLSTTALIISITTSPLDDPGKKKIRCTPRGTKVVIYHLVGNFMLNSMQNVVSLATCAESL